MKYRTAAIFAAVGVLMASAAWAEGFNRFGDYSKFSVNFGRSGSVVPGASMDDDTLYWGEVALVFGDRLTDSAWVEVAPVIGYLHWSHSDDAGMLGFRLRGGYDMFTIPGSAVKVAVFLGGGLATLTDWSGHYYLGDSGFYGIIEGGIVFKDLFGTGNNMAIVWDHLSDILRHGDDKTDANPYGDAGINTLSLKFEHDLAGNRLW